MNRWILKQHIRLVLGIIIIAAIMIQTYRLLDLNSFINELIEEAEENVDENKEIKVLEKVPEDYQEVLLLYRDEDARIVKTYRSLNIELKKINVSNSSYEEELSELKTNDLLVVGFKMRASSKLANNIFKFMRAGGKVLFAVPTYEAEYIEALGIKEDAGEIAKELSNIKFEKKVFPGLDDIKENYETKVSNVHLINLKEDVEILMTAEDNPIVWRGKYGEGEYIFLNGDISEKSNFRGVVAIYTSMLNDYFLYKTWNAKMLSVDNFPASFEDKYTQKIKQKYEMTDREFIYRIWWPFVYNLAGRYNLKITAYSNLRSYDADEIINLKEFGEALVTLGSEIGIVVNDQMDINLYLTEVRKKIEEVYSGARVSNYKVNTLNKELIETNEFNNSKVFYEFIEGDIRNLLESRNIKIISDTNKGYEYSKKMIWNAFDSIAYDGYVHKLIDSKYIFSEASKNETWKDLEKSFDKYMGEINKKFGYLKPYTTSSFLNIKQEKLNQRIYIYREEGDLKVETQSYTTPTYAYLRLKNETISKVNGGESWLISPDSKLYLIRLDKKKVTIELS